MARILLGVTGGIAAYKALELARLAIKAGHAVRVVQTEASTRFVGTHSFAAITGAPVLLSEWEPDPFRGAFPGDSPRAHAPLSHLALVDAADVFVIAPASANTLSKLAAGAADNLLTAAALACRRPLLLAPAMNDAMYEHAATRANLRRLRERGAIVLDPGVGALGSLGEWGVGRLAEPADILTATEDLLATPGATATEAARMASAARGGASGPTTDVVSAPAAVRAGERLGDLAGSRVLVTAGGTREPIDAVRYVGNRSSGRMGWALAAEAADRSAAVTVIAASVSLERDPRIEYVDVETAAELAAACRERFPASDVLLMAAAVADFRPSRAAAGKLKKGDNAAGLTVVLEPTEDVLSALAAERREGQCVVGFAAEHGERALEYGRGKLERKGLDAIVVNDVSQPGIGFDAGDNEVTIITRDGEHHVARSSKRAVARALLDVVAELRAGATAGSVR